MSFLSIPKPTVHPSMFPVSYSETRPSKSVFRLFNTQPLPIPIRKERGEALIKKQALFLFSSSKKKALKQKNSKNLIGNRGFM